MTSYPRWRIVNIEATSLLNRTSTSTYKQPQSTSIIEIIRNKFTFMLHTELVNYFITVKPDTNYFTASYRVSSSSIASLCIHFQHRIVYPVPALHHCASFQHRIVYPVPASHYCASSSSSVSRYSFRIVSTLQYMYYLPDVITGQRRE